MAEIHIERKKSVWPWVVGLIVTLLLIWGALALMGDDRREAGFAEQPAATAPATMPATTPAIDPTAPATETTGDAAREPPPATEGATPPQQ